MKENKIKKNPKEKIKKPDLDLLETNIDFDENIYFNHYFSVFGKFEFEFPIKDMQIPYIMSREFLYSCYEVRKNIKPASSESITQIKGRIKQFSNSLDQKFNIMFFDNIKSYTEMLGIEETKNILIPVLVKVALDKTDVKIHFLKILYQDYIDYLCSLGDEGINILRQNIVQIIQELYRDKNLTNETLKALLFKVFIKLAKSIIPKEKDKKDNYMLDLVMSFGYESNVSKEFYLDHKKLCIKFISSLAEDFGQDWAENYLLPQIWFFGSDEEEEIKKEVLIALPSLCQELKYEIIGTKVFKLMKKLSSDKSTNIKQGAIAALAKIIKIYKEKSKVNQEKKENDENNNNIKLQPGSVNNFLLLIEKLILDKQKSVRDTIMEYIGEIISPLDKDELPQKLFDFYKNTVNEFYYNKEMILSGNNNTNTNTNTKNKNDKKDEKGKKEEKEKKEKKENVNYYFAYNFPAILFCYGKDYWPKLNFIFTNLCKEKDIKVRRSIIASFHEISKIVGEKITEEELLPLYDNFLNSKIPLEKNFAIKNLPKILSGVNKEIKEKYFKYFDAVSIFQQNMTSKVRNFFFINWRNKIDVIEGILCYYHLYDKEIIYKSILPQCINFCFDDVYKVRSVSCKILATLILYLYNEKYKIKELFELLELFALHKKYYQRICFAKMCKLLLENNNLYKEKVQSLLYILVKHDNSKNVRVALSKSLAKVLKNNKFNCINDISFHKLCRILYAGNNTSIKNIFTMINIKNCENINENELFDLNDINKIIGNKEKIFDKDNTFIKKEFDFDINECQHKYQKRDKIILNKKEKIVFNDKNIQKEPNIIIKKEEKKVNNENIKGEENIIKEIKEDKEDVKNENKNEILEEDKKEDDNNEEIKDENKEEKKENDNNEEIKDDNNEQIEEIKDDNNEQIEEIKDDNNEQIEEIKEDHKKEEENIEKIKDEDNNINIEIKDENKGEKKEDNNEEKKEEDLEIKLEENKEVIIEKNEENKDKDKDKENIMQKENENLNIKNEEEINNKEIDKDKDIDIIEKINDENNINNEKEEKDITKEDNTKIEDINEENKINENDNIINIEEDKKQNELNEEVKKEDKEQNDLNQDENKKIDVDNNIEEKKEEGLDEEDIIENKNEDNNNEIKDEQDDNENKEEKNQNQEGGKRKRKKNKRKK